MSKRRKPDWLKIKIGSGNKFQIIKHLTENQNINTICRSGKCPNLGTCWSNGTATFMILGDICTRNCHFCATKTGIPIPVDEQEPQLIANAIKHLQLHYAIITSVSRDDLPDYGAASWRKTIETCKKLNPTTIIETLIPDFQGNIDCLEQISLAKPHIISHNIETVRSLTAKIRNKAQYDTSLKVLHYFSDKGYLTKSGFMIGMGEKYDEVLTTINDLRNAGCMLLTIGQYLQATTNLMPVVEYVHPKIFEQYKEYALSKGFLNVESAPLVRSSYMAEHSLNKIIHIIFPPTENNYDLQNLHTFQCNVKTAEFINIDYRFQIRYVFDLPLKKPFYILGGGSNVLFAYNIKGAIVKMSTKGKKIIKETKNYAIIEIESGENWDDVVKFCLENKLYGIENLSGIPGTVGGAVVQNIGAYGQEISKLVHQIEVFDINCHDFILLSPEQCHFEYRQSIFKNQQKLRFIVSRIYLKLYKVPKLNINHESLKKYFSQHPNLKITPYSVRQAIMLIRSERLPELTKFPNAGSFFKNPIIKKEHAKELLSTYPDLKTYPIDKNHVKISAGWLIEKSGLKGKRLGLAQISEKHALIIISDAGAPSSDILQLYELIQKTVYDKFQIWLEPEIVILG